VIVVIFEVEPAPGRRDDYLRTATVLMPLLERVEGIISIERFQSLPPLAGLRGLTQT